MFLQQIVRERAVPLSLSLDSNRALYADLLTAQIDRAQGYQGRASQEVSSDMLALIEKAERDDTV